MYPEQFVAVPGDTDRKKILKAFSSQLRDHTFENDFAALDFLRNTLSSPDNQLPFDFYEVEILKCWNPQSKRLGWLTRRGQDTSDDVTTEAMESLPINEDTKASTFAGLIDVTHLAEPRLQEINELLKDKKQLIFEGPPGSGKTYVAEKFARWFTSQSLDANIPSSEQVEIVQFHQSYGYEDFVQGMRPGTNVDGQLVYHVRDGIFLNLCERAQESLDRKDGKKYVLIIDEIHRGHISRIFGELLLLLEYRGMSVRLPYGSGDQATLTIPENLYIIGTMNTADRSLAQIDYALRRRFYFVRFMPVEDGRAEVFGNWLENQDMEQSDRSRLLHLFVTLNYGIREHLSTDDLQIGHSYFMTDGIETDVVLNRVWTRAVSPLLNEYLHHHRNREEIPAALTPASLVRTTVEVDSESDMPLDAQANGTEPDAV